MTRKTDIMDDGLYRLFKMKVDDETDNLFATLVERFVDQFVRVQEYGITYFYVWLTEEEKDVLERSWNRALQSSPDISEETAVVPEVIPEDVMVIPPIDAGDL